jgi:hypothetical protein
MTITNETGPYRSASSDYTGGPLFSSLDILGGIVAAAMLLLPLTAAGTHYSKVGWDTVQAESSR